MKDEIPIVSMSGNRLLLILAALANPHRRRIVERLHAGGRNYISKLFAAVQADLAEINSVLNSVAHVLEEVQ